MSFNEMTEEQEREEELRLEAEYEARLAHSTAVNAKYRRLRNGWLALFVLAAVFYLTNLGSSLSRGMQYAAAYPLSIALFGLIMTWCWRVYALHPERGIWAFVKKNLVFFFLASAQLVSPLAIIGNHRWALLTMIVCLGLTVVESALNVFFSDMRKRYTLLGVIHD